MGRTSKICLSTYITTVSLNLILATLFFFNLCKLIKQQSSKRLITINVLLTITNVFGAVVAAETLSRRILEPVPPAQYPCENTKQLLTVLAYETVSRFLRNTTFQVGQWIFAVSYWKVAVDLPQTIRFFAPQQKDESRVRQIKWIYISFYIGISIIAQFARYWNKRNFYLGNLVTYQVIISATLLQFLVLLNFFCIGFIYDALRRIVKILKKDANEVVNIRMVVSLIVSYALFGAALSLNDFQYVQLQLDPDEKNINQQAISQLVAMVFCFGSQLILYRILQKLQWKIQGIKKVVFVQSEQGDAQVQIINNFSQEEILFESDSSFDASIVVVQMPPRSSQLMYTNSDGDEDFITEYTLAASRLTARQDDTFERAILESLIIVSRSYRRQVPQELNQSLNCDN